MFSRYALFIIFFYGFTSYPVTANAQSRLFDNDDILHFKLVGKLNELFNDRKKWRIIPCYFNTCKKTAALYQFT